MTRIGSPRCGEVDDLHGDRAGDVITITCGACATVWDRDTSPSCGTCGSTDVRPAFEAIVEKSRGTQLSMQSVRLVYLCPRCDAERLAEYQVSNRPLPPPELPTASGQRDD
ncbi:MAG: hypothetical protein RIF41_26155 [Polyangiaceae bacterium]